MPLPWDRLVTWSVGEETDLVRSAECRAQSSRYKVGGGQGGGEASGDRDDPNPAEMATHPPSRERWCLLEVATAYFVHQH